MPAEASDLASRLVGVADGLTGVLNELREIARGIHPAAVAEGGVRPALMTLARRCAVPGSPIDHHLLRVELAQLRAGDGSQDHGCLQ